MNILPFKPAFLVQIPLRGGFGLRDCLQASCGHPPSYYHESSDHEILVIGSPIIQGKCSLIETARFLDSRKNDLATIDGQFLAFRQLKGDFKLEVINDRFNGVPFYYAILDGFLVGSNIYSELASILARKGRWNLENWNFMEFISFQRLIHDKTYDNISRFLLPGTILSFSNDGFSRSRYWKPHFTIDWNLSNRKAGQQYTDLAVESIKKKTSDLEPGSYGLFLSGGHDSRTVLAAFEHPPHCFTVGFTDNLEVQCARACAIAVNAQHSFLPLKRDFLSERLDQISWLCGGMFSIDNTLFVGFEDYIPETVKVIFHGHGLDYLFHGMYLPAKTRHLFGRPTFIKSLQRIAKEVEDHYIEQLPFRTWDVRIADYLLPKYRQEYQDRLRNAVSEVLLYGQDSFDSKEGAWEYLITHAPGRHYSYPNISSKESLREQRIPCFDNELYDFYTRVPLEYRLDGSLMRTALNTLAPKLGRIPTGNYGLPAGWSPRRKTAALVAKKIAKEFTRSKKFSVPDSDDRTWPDRDTYIRTRPAFQKTMSEAISSEVLRDNLPFLNWGQVEQLMADTISGRASAGKFLTSLLSVERFLKQIGP